MHPLTWIRDEVRRRLRRLIQAELEATLVYAWPQLMLFHGSTPEDRQSYHDLTRDPAANQGRVLRIRDRLLTLGVPLDDIQLDIPDFEAWLTDFSDLQSHYEPMGEVALEKCLEHYLAFHYLRVSPGDVYIDIAASDSPWARMLKRRGVEAYRLDLSYRKGRRGINIGADATDTGLPSGFCTALSAHCAYETFEGDADVRFLQEASRILNDRGRYAIAPLYLDSTYFIATSALSDQRAVEIDPGARRVWRDDDYVERFARHYSPDSFATRIYANLPSDTRARVLYVSNLVDLMTRYPGQRLYCFFVFHCEKTATNSSRDHTPGHSLA